MGKPRYNDLPWEDEGDWEQRSAEVPNVNVTRKIANAGTVGLPYFIRKKCRETPRPQTNCPLSGVGAWVGCPPRGSYREGSGS
jgi:hypothetical protein